MDPIVVVAVLLGIMFVLLGSGVWIGPALMAVAAIAIDVIAGRPAGSSIATTVWSSSSSWMLTALPMFVWMGDILFHSRLSEDLFRGLAPLMGRLPGGLLHTNVLGCTLFGSVSGSSVATLTTVGKMTIPELRKRNYPEHLVISSLAGPATLGLMIPPSIIMIVYGALTNESIAAINIAGILPGLVLAALFSGYVAFRAKTLKDYRPVIEPHVGLKEKLHGTRRLIPVIILLTIVIGSMFAGIATATEAAATGVLGAFGLAWWQGTLTRQNFIDGLMSATRSAAMISLILVSAGSLSLAMSFLGLPQLLAEWVASFHLSAFWLLMGLLVLYTILGHFLDGISCVALTISIVEPMVRQAGIDMIWFGIFIVLVVEMAQITPPVGLNLTVLQSMTGHDIFRIGWWSVPMHIIMVVMVFIMIAFPGLATWLPHQMIPVHPHG
jgi:C4-dicarboxylate transporter, DctM subunit